MYATSQPCATANFYGKVAERRKTPAGLPPCASLTKPAALEDGDVDDVPAVAMQVAIAEYLNRIGTEDSLAPYSELDSGFGVGCSPPEAHIHGCTSGYQLVTAPSAQTTDLKASICFGKVAWLLATIVIMHMRLATWRRCVVMHRSRLGEHCFDGSIFQLYESGRGVRYTPAYRNTICDSLCKCNTRSLAQMSAFHVKGTASEYPQGEEIAAVKSIFIASRVYIFTRMKSSSCIP